MTLKTKHRLVWWLTLVCVLFGSPLFCLALIGKDGWLGVESLLILFIPIPAMVAETIAE